MKGLCFTVTVATLILLTFVGLSLAAEKETAEWEYKSHGLRLEAGTEVLLNSEIGDHGAEGSEITSRIAASWRGPISVGIEYERSDVTWNGVGRLPFGDGRSNPWETLNSIRLSVGKDGMVSGKWGYFAGMGLTCGYERDLDDSLSTVAFMGVAYAVSSRLVFRLGPAVWWSPVEVMVFPVVGIHYEPDGLNLSMDLGFPRTSVAWSPYDWMSLALYARVQEGLYRLADDSSVARAGYVQRMSLRTGVDLDFTLTRHVSLSLGLVYEPWGSLTLYDNHGEEWDDWEAMGGLGGRVGLDVSF